MKIHLAIAGASLLGSVSLSQAQVRFDEDSQSCVNASGAEERIESTSPRQCAVIRDRTLSSSVHNQTGRELRGMLLVNVRRNNMSPVRASLMSIG